MSPRWPRRGRRAAERVAGGDPGAAHGYLAARSIARRSAATSSFPSTPGGERLRRRQGAPVAGGRQRAVRPHLGEVQRDADDDALGAHERADPGLDEQAGVVLGRLSRERGPEREAAVALLQRAQGVAALEDDDELPSRQRDLRADRHVAQREERRAPPARRRRVARHQDAVAGRPSGEEAAAAHVREHEGGACAAQRGSKRGPIAVVDDGFHGDGGVVHQAACRRRLGSLIAWCGARRHRQRQGQRGARQAGSDATGHGCSPAVVAASCWIDCRGTRADPV